MRTMPLCLGAACVVLMTVSGAFAAAPLPDSGDQAVLVRSDAPARRGQDQLQDQSQERWQGRHHYLFDDADQQRRPETTGSGSSDARACARETVRLRRSDGTTVLRHFKRCE